MREAEGVGIFRALGRHHGRRSVTGRRRSRLAGCLEKLAAAAEGRRAGRRGTEWGWEVLAGAMGRARSWGRHTLSAGVVPSKVGL